MGRPANLKHTHRGAIRIAALGTLAVVLLCLGMPVRSAGADAQRNLLLGVAEVHF